jgi:hypothetical protein
MPESAAVLAATGDAGTRRLVSIAFGEESEPFDNPIPDADGRDAIDQWSAALSVVAVAATSAFMDAIARKAFQNGTRLCRRDTNGLCRRPRQAAE